MKRKILSLCLILSVLLLSACSTSNLEHKIDALDDRIDRLEDLIENKLESALTAPSQATVSASAPAKADKPQSDVKLTFEEAESIALEHAGLSSENVSRLRTKLDMDDGFMEYDVSFIFERTEYEYEINADTGDIISFDLDK